MSSGGGSHGTASKALILGSRRYSEVLIDMFECMSGQIEFVGAIENQDRERCSERIMGLPIHWHETIAPMAATHRLVCALGTTLRRNWIEECLSMGFRFENLLHPSSVVSGRTKLGDGIIIDAGCVVAGFTTFEDHVRIGRRTSIGHHTRIGRYSTVHPGAIISGNCQIGEQTLISTGSIVLDGVSIGGGAVISAGSVVRHDVPARALVSGSPARLMRKDYGPK
jgi:sugar O-acyltransferase (sialic acid O-acetyltransferase NeuD family)